MSKTFDVAIVGATGAVGEALIEILEQRGFPVGELYLLASERSAGSSLKFKNKSIKVSDLAEFDFSKVQIGLFSAGGSISEIYAPKAAAAGCIVIDNTSHFRYDDDIPLVVPEVNPEAIAGYTTRNIIANPNCSTIQMLVALKPIHDAVGIKRISVSTYQAVSGTGKSAIEELAGQTAQLLNGREAKTEVYPQQIAFNALPQIDVFLENGYTKEEMKLVNETHKILDPSIQVTATAVRIPVVGGHSESVNLSLNESPDLDDIRSILSETPGIVVQDNLENNEYPMPLTAANKNEVFVGRIRKDESQDKGINLWIVADNLRKGAATNTVQIAEVLHSKGWV